MTKIGKRITLPSELVEWAEEIIDESKIPGIRSLSGLCERALDDLRKKMEDQK
ncbi:hypothetical protein ES703_47246 [subsurface metagenome]